MVTVGTTIPTPTAAICSIAIAQQTLSRLLISVTSQVIGINTLRATSVVQIDVYPLFV
jgi:hypothetical protein